MTTTETATGAPGLTAAGAVTTMLMGSTASAAASDGAPNAVASAAADESYNLEPHVAYPSFDGWRNTRAGVAAWYLKPSRSR